MNSRKSFKTKLQIAAASLLMGLQLSAQAQVIAGEVVSAGKPNSGVLNIGGQISDSTCMIEIKDNAGTEIGGTKTVDLGTLSSATVGTGGIGSVFGAAKTVSFSVKSLDGTSTCTLAAANTAWDIALGLGAEDIITINGVTHLKNARTTDATDAAVLLKGGIGNTANTTLALRGGLGNSGTLTSGGAAPTAKSSESIVLSAQFVRSAAAAPTAGLFSSTIPLMVVYK